MVGPGVFDGTPRSLTCVWLLLLERRENQLMGMTTWNPAA